MLHTYRRLGELLVARSAISPLQLSVALADQAISGRRLGEIMVERGYTTEEEVIACLAYQYGHPIVDLGAITPQPEALKKLTADEAISSGALPLELHQNTLICAISDPIDTKSISRIEAATRCRLDLRLASRSELIAKTRTAYRLRDERPSPPKAVVGAPERFKRLQVIQRQSSATLYSAVDSELERTVSLISFSESEPTYEQHKNFILGASRGFVEGIAPIYDCISGSGLLWTVTKLVEGESLQSILETRGPRPLSQAAALVSRLAECIDQLQRLGGSGLFVCPANVMMRASGPMLLPFAMPPASYSVAEGEMPGPASAFVLGRLLADCLGGEEGIPRELGNLMSRCRLDGHNRFHSAIEVACALRSYDFGGSAADQVAAVEVDETVTDGSLAKRTIWSRLMGKAS